MEKAKRKRNDTPTTKPTLDFLAPYSLEECAERLMNLVGRESRDPLAILRQPLSYLTVEMMPVDDDTAEYQMEWRARKRILPFSTVYGQANGRLSRWDSRSTRVQADSRLAAKHAAPAVGLLALVFVVWARIAWTAAFDNMLEIVVSGLLLVAAIGYLTGLSSLTLELTNLVQRTLQPIEKPKRG